jgi:chemotaxis protein methyltransferase CheR
VRPHEIALVGALVRARVGLKIGDRAYHIETRLDPVARGAGFGGVSDLLAALRAGNDRELEWRVIEAMTASETRFFRDKAVFAALERDILPRLARARSGASVKVWSAACSTGQEIYSLAMIAENAAAEGGEARLDLAASDVSAAALTRAKSGLYTQFEVQRGLPIRMLARHFEKADEMWRVSPEVRRRVRWRRVNLIGDLSGIGGFDVILCRNVLGDMDPAYQTKVLHSLARLLPRDGCLVLGLEETADTAEGLFHPAPGYPGIFLPDPAFREAAA